MIDSEIRTDLDNGFRSVEEAKQWIPHMDMLSNDELEKLLIAQERNIRLVVFFFFFVFVNRQFSAKFFLFMIRRMRRETRFKRQTRGRQ